MPSAGRGGATSWASRGWLTVWECADGSPLGGMLEQPAIATATNIRSTQRSPRGEGRAPALRGRQTPMGVGWAVDVRCTRAWCVCVWGDGVVILAAPVLPGRDAADPSRRQMETGLDHGNALVPVGCGVGGNPTTEPCGATARARNERSKKLAPAAKSLATASQATIGSSLP